MRVFWLSVAALVLLAAGLYLNNTSLFAPERPGRPVLLAHRGIAQRFDTAGLTNDTCTASRMLPPTNGYLENTIASMRAGFEAGADIVEFDIHPTSDGQFAVFHDWTLDCRTDGHGVTREQSMAHLKTLDIGHGYTADSGKTYPFRGKGVGLLPSMDEVLEAFPGRRFLINVKSNDPAEGETLATALNRLAPERRALLMVYGGDRPIARLAALVPGLKTMSRASLKACLIRYIGYGWTGIVPEACRSMLVFVPVNIAPWLWGWPNRFLERLASVGSVAFLVGPYHGGDFSTGIDSAEDLARLPAGYAGGLLTNEIETVARKLGVAMPPPLTFAQLLDICGSSTVPEAAGKGDKLGWLPLSGPKVEEWRRAFVAHNGGSVQVVGWRRGEKDGDGLLSFRIAQGPSQHRACSYSLADPAGLLEALTERFGAPASFDKLEFGTTAFWKRASAEIAFSQVGSSAGVIISHRD